MPEVMALVQVQIIEADSLSELNEKANEFLQKIEERNVIDIKFQNNLAFTAEELLEQYAVLILYCVRTSHS